MAKKKNKETYVVPHQKDFTLYKNQQALVINKPDYAKEGTPFLQVGIDEWMEAKSVMKDCEFTLYLYCASNKDGYMKALSPTDFCNKTGMARSSYQEAKKGLIEMGYLDVKKANGKTLLYDVVHFYTHPSRNPNWEKAQDSTSDE